MLKRTKLLDAGVSVAMPMLSPELDLTAALTSQFSEQFLWATVRLGRLDAALQRLCVFTGQFTKVFRFRRQSDLLGNPSDFVGGS